MATKITVCSWSYEIKDFLFKGVKCFRVANVRICSIQLWLDNYDGQFLKGWCFTLIWGYFVHFHFYIDNLIVGLKGISGIGFYIS